VRIEAALAAGRPLPPEDLAAILAATRETLATGRSFCASLGLSGNWRTAIRRREREAAARAAQRDGEAVRKAARRLRGELIRYASTAAFKAARQSGRGGILFDLLRANGWKPPSEPTLRNWLS
jgi:hypothetical protein